MAPIDDDPLLQRLRSEAEEVAASDPVGLLGPLLSRTVLSPSITTFEDAVALIVAHRLTVFCPAAFPLARCRDNASATAATDDGDDDDASAEICSPLLLKLFRSALSSPETEAGHTMSAAIRADAAAIVRRDPACETLLEAVVFAKGYAALVCHRAARRLWPNKDREDGSYRAVPGGGGGGGGGGGTSDGVGGPKAGATTSKIADRFAALLLQSQAAAAFGVDIHPAAAIGSGVVFDHATGVVIGETATIGDGCTILHGVTLGGTAKDGSWDRHPKIGRDCLIGAGSSILGNIRVGDGAKIGSGSVVLRPIPSGATAVGAPAKIIGFAREERPGSTIDLTLDDVEPLVKSISSVSSSFLSQGSAATSMTEAVTSDMEEEEADGDNGDEESEEEEEEKADAEGEGEAPDEGIETPPGCRKWVAPGRTNSDLCPFRALKCGSGVAIPPGAVKRKTLYAILLQEGCSEDEICEVYFALLRFASPTSPARKYGYIPPCAFRRHFPECAAKFTRIDPARADMISRGDAKDLKLCRRATVAFRGVFEGLHDLNLDDMDDDEGDTMGRRATIASVGSEGRRPSY